MEWNVIYHKTSTQTIEVFNIFQHSGFYADVIEAFKKFAVKEDFAQRVKTSLMYYFWCKAEWEVLIFPWCGGKADSEIKVDVYWQVMNNWNIFIDYVWNYLLNSDTEVK